MKNIEILHEDNISIAVNKPAGLAVQGGAGVKTSLDTLLAKIRNPAPLLVHRLDKDTSGVLIAAKGREAAAKFSKIFGVEKKAEKIYTAVCAFRPEQDKGIINEDLEIRGERKKSETSFKVIESGFFTDADLEVSVLELRLGTGRTHQIRRHLAMIGNPILGDDKYGDFSLNKKLRKAISLKHLLLHSTRLIIKDFKLDIQAALPPYFLRLNTL